MPIVALPDGASVNIPDDATPEQLSQFKQKLSEKYGAQSGGQSNNVDYKPDRLQSFLTGVGQSFPGADEAAAKVYSMVNNVSYDEARKSFQQGIDANQKENPLSFIVGSLAPLIAGGVGAKAAKTALDIAPEAGKLAEYAAANPIKTAAGTGAVSGGVYGFGAGEGSAEERAKSAAVGAAVGAPLGAAGGYIADKIGGGLDTAISRLATKQAIKSGELPATVEDSLSPATKKVMEKLRLDYPDEADYQKALDSYFSSKGKGLVETVGPETQTSRLAEGANQFPSAANATKEYFDDRVGGSGTRIKQKITNYVSPKTNYMDELDNIVSSGRKAAAPFYQQAYTENPSIASPKIDRILSTPAGKNALSEASKDIQNEMSLAAKPDPELTQIAGEIAQREGTDIPEGGVASGLKLKTLDYVKRSFDRNYSMAKRAGDMGEMKRISDLKNGLVSEVDSLDKSGAYAKARQVSGDYLSNSDALEAGRNFMKDDIEQIQRKFSDYGRTEKESYRAGVAKAIRDQIDNTPDGYNVSKLFNKTATRDKLSTVLNPKDYDNLLGYVKQEDNIFKLRNQISNNSRTKIRDIAAQEFDNDTLNNIQEIAQKGWKDTAIDRTFGFLKKIGSGLSDKTAGEVADILYETDPQKKYQILQNLRQTSIAAKSQLQRTEAAKKLELFYGANDIIRNARVTQGIAAGENSGTRSDSQK